LRRIVLLGDLLSYPVSDLVGAHDNVPNDCSTDTVAVTIAYFVLADECPHKFLTNQAA